jgi:hypothetical protein
VSIPPFSTLSVFSQSDKEAACCRTLVPLRLRTGKERELHYYWVVSAESSEAGLAGSNRCHKGFASLIGGDSHSKVLLLRLLLKILHIGGTFQSNPSVQITRIRICELYRVHQFQAAVRVVERRLAAMRAV